MKSYLLFSFVLIFYVFTTSCSDSTSNNRSTARSTKNISDTSTSDTSTVAIIQFDKQGNWPFPDNYSPTTLTNPELVILDSIIVEHISVHNETLDKKIKEHFEVNFQKFKYKRQYVPVINIKGEKEVWANFFCNDWKGRSRNEILIVDDGGNCFFNLKVNLTTKTAYELMVNGYADNGTKTQLNDSSPMDFISIILPLLSKYPFT